MRLIKHNCLPIVTTRPSHFSGGGYANAGMVQDVVFLRLWFAFRRYEQIVSCEADNCKAR